MMKCAEFKSLLHAYFLEALASSERRRVDDHAASCEACGGLMRVARELTCREFVQFVNDFVDAELSPKRREVFERHIAICGDCQRYLDGYRETMRLSALALRDRQPLVPPEPPEKLVLAILEALDR